MQSPQIMQDPVIAGDGIYYERKAIQEWLKYKNRSFVTGKPISKYIDPDPFLKKIIDGLLLL